MTNSTAKSGCVDLQVADQLRAGHFGHDDVGDDQVEFLLSNKLDGLGAAGAGDRLVVQILKRIDGRRADPRIVLDQQDARAGDVGLAFGALHRRVQPHVAAAVSVRGR